jgi:hypothetical protein
MAGKNTGDFEYGFPVYGGVYIGDMEYGSVPVIGETGAPLAGDIWVKVAGVWTLIVSVWAKVSGTWLEVDVSAKVGGTWKLIHEK